MVRKSKRWSSALLFLSLCLGLQAQDIHFSQFFNTPLVTNPALTGDYNGDWRICGAYRSQWSALGSPFTTADISVDKTFRVNDKKISAGLMVLNDKSGEFNFQVNKIFLSGAYHHNLQGHQISGGVQLGIVMKGIDMSKMTFPDQYDHDQGAYSTAFSNNEGNLSPNITYPDMNIGLAWKKRFGKIEPQVGVSLFHVMFMKENFTSNSAILPIRYVYFGKANFLIGNNLFAEPMLYWMNTSGASEGLGGGRFGIFLPENPVKIKSVYAGALFRDGNKSQPDAGIAMIGAKVSDFDLGVSYDFNISDLQQYTNRKGALEFTLIYILPKLTPAVINIPCDRI